MDNHNKFLEHLEASSSGVLKAAEWLIKKGINVRIPGMQKAPTHAEWKKYVDSGDIFIEKRVEIKTLSATFTSKIDWPFRDKFIVCAKHAWETAKPKPYIFMILNESGSHAAIVKQETSEKWYIEKRKDSRYDNVEQEFFFCPINLVQFIELN